jgi:hypothetical protein
MLLDVGAEGAGKMFTGDSRFLFAGAQDILIHEKDSQHADISNSFFKIGTGFQQ